MRPQIAMALIGCAVWNVGCGYHVAGRSNALPKSIHVIAVPALENRTSSYRIEQRLTAATVHGGCGAARESAQPGSAAAAV